MEIYLLKSNSHYFDSFASRGQQGELVNMKVNNSMICPIPTGNPLILSPSFYSNGSKGRPRVLWRLKMKELPQLSAEEEIRLVISRNAQMQVISYTLCKSNVDIWSCSQDDELNAAPKFSWKMPMEYFSKELDQMEEVNDFTFRVWKCLGMIEIKSISVYFTHVTVARSIPELAKEAVSKSFCLKIGMEDQAIHFINVLTDSIIDILRFGFIIKNAASSFTDIPCNQVLQFRLLIVKQILDLMFTHFEKGFNKLKSQLLKNASKNRLQIEINNLLESLHVTLSTATLADTSSMTSMIDSISELPDFDSNNADLIAYMKRLDSQLNGSGSKDALNKLYDDGKLKVDEYPRCVTDIVNNTLKIDDDCDVWKYCYTRMTVLAKKELVKACDQNFDKIDDYSVENPGAVACGDYLFVNSKDVRTRYRYHIFFHKRDKITGAYGNLIKLNLENNSKITQYFELIGSIRKKFLLMINRVLYSSDIGKFYYFDLAQLEKNPKPKLTQLENFSFKCDSRIISTERFLAFTEKNSSDGEMGILNIIPLFADKKCLNIGKMMTYDIEAAEKDIHYFEDEMFKHKLSTASLKTGSSHAMTKTHLVFDRVWELRRWRCTEKIINFLVAVNYVDDHDTIKIFEIPHESYLNYRMRSFFTLLLYVLKFYMFIFFNGKLSKLVYFNTICNELQTISQ